MNTFNERVLDDSLYRSLMQANNVAAVQNDASSKRYNGKFKTDRRRIDGENYEYHEQTKQTSHLSI